MDKKKLKVNIQKRVFPILAVFSLVFCLAVPGKAATTVVTGNEAYPTGLVNWMDYVSNVTVDGENNLLTVTIPAYWIFYRTLQGSTVREVGYGNHFTTVANSKTSTYIYPFGAVINADGGVSGGRLLDISNLPIGSRIDMVFDINFSGNDFSVDDHGYWNFLLYYYKWVDGVLTCQGSGTSSGTLTSSPLTESWTYLEHDYQDDYDVIGWSFQLNTLGGSDGAEDYELSVSYYASITMTLSTAYYEYLQGQENSAILNEIEQQLEDQNMTLDQILDELSVFEDNSEEIRGDVDSVVGDLESAGNALDSLDQPQLNVDELAPGEIFGDEYLAYVGVINVLYYDSTISRICSVMALLLITSVILFGKRG